MVLSKRMPSNVITAGSDARSARAWRAEAEARLPEEVVVFPWFGAEFEAVIPK